MSNTDSMITSNDEDNPIVSTPIKSNRYNFWVMMKKLLKSRMYLVGTLTMSVILFVSTGIQFWLTDYFINVLKIDREKVNIAYAIVSITGPTTGAGFGINAIYHFRWLYDQQNRRL